MFKEETNLFTILVLLGLVASLFWRLSLFKVSEVMELFSLNLDDPFAEKS